MGCVCHTHTPVRLYCLQRLVSHYVLQSHKELEVTVVAALVTLDGAWMGADSLASDGDLCSTTATPKVGRFGNILMGYAGSFHIGQKFWKVAAKAHQPTMEQVLESVKTDEKDWSLLFVENGRIFEVSDDYSVIEARKSSDGSIYGSIGSGAAVALGSLYTSNEDESALMRALEASQEHCTAVRGPFLIVSL
jgi:ATP-dependent protease HslVU (ClpYQ) peptidase subunit